MLQTLKHARTNIIIFLLTNCSRSRERCTLIFVPALRLLRMDPQCIQNGKLNQNLPMTNIWILRAVACGKGMSFALTNAQKSLHSKQPRT